MLWHRITRRLRTLLGRGWNAAEFERRYRAKPENAWGYQNNPEHAARVRRILQSLPHAPVQHLLEAGCAEGFLTRQLATRAMQVTACDLSAEAVRRAREYCAGLSNVQFVAADLRRHLPAGPFDAAVFSDVLYYLSVAENRTLAVRLRSILSPPGTLLIANEWNQSYRDLTHPKIAVECFTGTGLWTCRSLEEHPTGQGQMHVVAVLA